MKGKILGDHGPRTAEWGLGDGEPEVRGRRSVVSGEKLKVES